MDEGMGMATAMVLVTRREGLFPLWNSLFARHEGTETVVHTSLEEVLELAGTDGVRFCVVDVGSVPLPLAPPGRQLAELARLCRVLLVGSEFDVDSEMAALAAGVAGCCSNAVTAQEMATVFDVVLKGGIRVSKAALPRMLARLQEAAARQATTNLTDDGAAFDGRWSQLTRREKEIARQVADGANNKVIARHLNISDATIKAHLTSAFQKLQVSSRLQLALLLSSRAERVGSDS
jgi:two-component system nitrate/nitrite response regulator NarL